MSYSSFISTIITNSLNFITLIKNVMSSLLSNYLFKTFIYLLLFEFSVYVLIFIIKFLNSLFKVKDKTKIKRNDVE